MKILALDPATKCGWAHSNRSSGVWDLSVRKDESKGMKLVRLSSKLEDMKKIVELVVFEAARYAGPNQGNALVSHAEFQSVIKLWAINNKIDYRGYSATEIKKHATGKGNANKNQMIAAAISQGWNPKDDNEADALWLLNLAQSEYVPNFSGVKNG
jgi:Holliday junction resolvasome RuvABC endonuclease subunit